MSISTPVLCHPADATIVRVLSPVSPASDGNTQLYDDEGTALASFPASWSDDDIHRALAFANRAYALGVTAGKVQKIREFHKLLAFPS